MKRRGFILLPILIFFAVMGVITESGNLTLGAEAGGGEAAAEDGLTVVMVGDLYLSSWLEPILLKNPAYPYADPEIRELFDQADLVFGNLEAPFSQRGEVYVEKKYTFRCQPGLAPARSPAVLTCQ